MTTQPPRPAKPRTKRLLIMLAVITAGFLVLVGGCSALLFQVGTTAVHF